MNVLPGNPPPGTGSGIAWCLQADPARRFQSAEEIARALGPSRAYRWGLILLVAIMLVVIVVSMAIWFGTRPRTIYVPPPKPQRLTAASIESPIFRSSLSPDGKTIAYGDEFGIHLQLI